MVEASDWLHCPFDSSTLPSEKTVRMRQQGKAVGGTQPTALLFEQAGLSFLMWIKAPIAILRLGV
jgi:hypothetical protein